jgi:tRNA A37 N6-isopentenylltransferase MiaA
MLGKKYGWESEAMTGNIYPLLHQYLDGTLTLDEVKRRFVTLDWRLAKRQLTWLRRNEFIQWLSLTDAKSYLSSVLSEH